MVGSQSIASRGKPPGYLVTMPDYRGLELGKQLSEWFGASSLGGFRRLWQASFQGCWLFCLGTFLSSVGSPCNININEASPFFLFCFGREISLEPVIQHEPAKRCPSFISYWYPVGSTVSLLVGSTRFFSPRNPLVCECSNRLRLGRRRRMDLFESSGGWSPNG